MATTAQREEPARTDAIMSLDEAIEITANAVDTREHGHVQLADLTPRHHVRVGDRVRSYDFPQNLALYRLHPNARRYGNECYVEGTVKRIVRPEGATCATYEIEVERRVWGGEEVDVEDGELATPPVNGTPEWTGGVTFGVFRLDD